jgi:hypothetical protein
MTEYVYLLQEREFLNSKVYKIGKTKRPINQRMVEYPKGSVPIICIKVSNCDDCEKELIAEFKRFFKHRKDIGNETFEGEEDDFVNMFLQIAQTGYLDNVLGKVNLNRLESTPLLSYKIISVEWNENVKNKIVMWKCNREPDEDRVLEIYKSMKEGNYVPKCLHLAKSEDGNSYVCFDGNHRRLAFNKFLEEGKTNIVDLIIFDTSDNTAIHTFFKNLSKALSVPEMLIEDLKNNKSGAIESFVNNYKKKYKDFFKDTESPRKPHTNVSLFTNSINLYMNETKKSVLDIEKILFDKNEEYKIKSIETSWRKKYSNTVLEKCDKYKFYIFIDGQEIFNEIK